MKDLYSSRPPLEAFHTVTDPQQAKLLTDPTSKAFFKPFLARECTVKQAASEVGYNLTTVLYRVKTFLKAGLLEVAREEKRGGRPIKHYRSVHDAYLIPDGLTPYADLEERLMRQMRPFSETVIRSLARVYRERGWGGQHIYRAREDVVTTSLATDAAGLANFWSVKPPFEIYSDISLYLSAAEAEALAGKLLTLLSEASRKIERGEGKRYILQVVFVPPHEVGG